MFLRITLVIIMLVLAGCERSKDVPAANSSIPDSRMSKIRTDMKEIRPFFRPMGKPAKYDWLGSHNEPGETFEEFIARGPKQPTADRRTIYVLPLGDLSQRQIETLNAAAEYLEIFFDLPLKVLSRVSLDRPSNTRDSRTTRKTNIPQIRTGYVLNNVLRSRLPADGVALIALTSFDLFIDSSTNYVFGEASMKDHVGVWSLFRLGENASKQLFLRRAIKIAAHETGHMFSMRHCTKYECLMSGTNYLGETDRRPIDACPECTAKIWWLSGADPVRRYQRLEAFCRTHGLSQEAAEFARKAAAVK